MRAILKREFKAYFWSPLAYVFISVMYFFTGYYFFTYNLYGATTDMAQLFSLMFSVVLFLIPILTMRLMSEDKRQKTDQTLLTAPVSAADIVLGKYLSALCVFLIAVSGTLVCTVIMSFYAKPDWAVVMGNFTGIVLLGAAQIAICMFLSSLTESQVIAAVLGFGVSMFLMLADALTLVVSSPFWQVFFKSISFNDRYAPFTAGIIELSGVVFFLSVGALFVCLTVSGVEKRRWS